MIITSSLLFHLLSEHYSVVIHRQGTQNIPITTPMLLRNLKTAENVANTPGFYLCDTVKLLTKFRNPDSVFLIKGHQVDFNLADHCDAAFIDTDISLDILHFEVCEICRKLQEWDLSLKDAALDKTNLSRMLGAVQPFFPNIPSVVDRNYIVHGNLSDLVRSEILKDFPPIDSTKMRTPFSTINELLLDPEFVTSLHKEDVFIYHAGQPDASLCMNIFSKDQFLARIITSIAAPISPGILYLFRHIAHYIEFIFLNYTDDVIVKRQNDNIHLLLSDLIEKTEAINNKRICETLESYGWIPTHTYDVTVFRFSNIEELNHIYLYFCNHLEMEWLHSYAIKSANEIVWVVNNNLCNSQLQGRSRRQTLSYIIRDLVCRAGISNSFSDLSQLQTFYQQAVFALEKGASRNPHFWYAHFSDYTLDYILELIQTDFEAANLFQPGIARLIGYDQSTGNNLTNVLTTFITCNFNVTTAAEKLFMHRSTFNRQMKKIRDITKIDWHHEIDIDELLHALLSLKKLKKS